MGNHRGDDKRYAAGRVSGIDMRKLLNLGALSGSPGGAHSAIGYCLELSSLFPRRRRGPQACDLPFLGSPVCHRVAREIESRNRQPCWSLTAGKAIAIVLLVAVRS
jgi:hypothetical protein